MFAASIGDEISQHSAMCAPPPGVFMRKKNVKKNVKCDGKSGEIQTKEERKKYRPCAPHANSRPALAWCRSRRYSRHDGRPSSVDMAIQT